MADSFKFFPMNQQQILLDWVNTIDEPNCLLASNLEDLSDGNVFLEILTNILRKNNTHTCIILLNRIKSFLREDEDIDRTYKIIFEILAALIGKENLSYFNPDYLKRNDNKMILAFVYMLRDLHESRLKPSELPKEACYNNAANDDIYNSYPQTLTSQSNKNNLTFNRGDKSDSYHYGDDNRNLESGHYTSQKHYEDDNYNCRENSHKLKNELNNNDKDKYMLIKNEGYNMPTSYKNQNQIDSRNFQKNESAKKQNFRNNEELKKGEAEENFSNDEFENLEIKTLASQTVPEEKKRKYSFTKLKEYETDREEKTNRNDIYDSEISKQLWSAKNSKNMKNSKIEHNREGIKPQSLNEIKNFIRTNHDKSPTKITAKTIPYDELYGSNINSNNVVINKREIPINRQVYSDKTESVPASNRNFKQIQKTNPNKLAQNRVYSLTPKRIQKEANNLNKIIQKYNPDHSHVSHYTNNKSRSVSPTPTCSDIEKKNSHNISHHINQLNKPLFNANMKFDYNKTYSKKEKAQLNMIRGALIPSTNSNSNLITKNCFTVEISNYKVNLFKFIRPTLPIIDISYTSSMKYEPSAEFLKNSVFSGKSHGERETSLKYINEEDTKVQDDESISNLEKTHQEENIPHKQQRANEQNHHHLNRQYSHSEIPAQSQSELRQFTIPSNISISTSTTLKNKIYFWLVDVNILKENAIKVDDIPLLCTNGVLLCDLVNRLEGKSETVKGIIRKTTSKSHIQININKVLEHLRTIGKVNNRHLWSGIEIASGDEKTIWEFLDDIWYFYSNKNRDITSRRKRNNIPVPLALKAENVSTNDKLFEKASSRVSVRLRDEPEKITTREKNYELMISDIVNDGGQERSSNLATIQKNIANEISNALNKNSKNSNWDISSKRGDSSEKFTNSEIIAKNLGMTKIKKKNENIPTSNISRIVSSSNTTRNDQAIKKSQSNLHISPSYSNIPGSSKLLQTNTINKSNIKSINLNDKEKKKDCFVIFGKSNAKMLEKEIERYSTITLGSGCEYNSENSTPKNESNIGRLEKPNTYLASNIEKNKYNMENFPLNANIPRPYTKNKSTPVEIQFFSKDLYINSPTPMQADSPLVQKDKRFVSDEYNDRNDFILNEWLMSIGSKSAYKIDFLCEEIDEFKDGVLLAEIISILENKKVPGINPNAKSKAAYIKNISKCLEDMPCDFLWCEEEIANGNSVVIKSLLEQMKKSYVKESKYIQQQINKKR